MKAADPWDATRATESDGIEPRTAHCGRGTDRRVQRDRSGGQGRGRSHDGPSLALPRMRSSSPRLNRAKQEALDAIRAEVQSGAVEAVNVSARSSATPSPVPPSGLRAALSLLNPWGRPSRRASARRSLRMSRRRTGVARRTGCSTGSRADRLESSTVRPPLPKRGKPQL